MRPKTARRVAAGLVGAAALLTAGYGVLLFADPAALANSYGTPGLLSAVALLMAGSGALLISRLPSNAIGWILAAVGVDMALSLVMSPYADLGLAHHWPAANVAAWLSHWSFLPGVYLALTFLVLLFPDGHLPSPRWRWVAWLIGVLSLASFGAWAVDTAGALGMTANSMNPPSTGSPILGTLELLGNLTGVVSIAALIQRYRRSDAVVRHQIKWMMLALSIFVAVMVSLTVTAIGSGDMGPPSWTAIAFDVALATIPVALSIGVLKYRLYDIDIIVSRTLVYGSLAALITGVYVGIAVGIGELVGSGGKPNLGLSILATAIVAIGFQPARERLQRVANRLVYGKRATPYQVLSEFSSHVAGSYAADEVLPRMARVLQEGTGAETATVWLRSGSELRESAAYPDTAPDERARSVSVNGSLPPLPGVTRAVDVRHQGELLGALSVIKRRGESLTPVEEKLLSDLAHQAGLVLKNVGLTADLQRRLEELRLSRQRLVSAQDAERRRLERNLHDGAQQHLVALKVKLGLAEMLAARDPEKAKATLQQLKADADEALETLRDLARGIYPPLLAEKGLAVALESQARKATLPVEVDSDGIGRYPQELEATVYFCVLEALQNVQKYAAATHGVVRLRDVDGELRFEVEDDGRGFDVEHVQRGAGLTNMQDRLDALGGAVHLDSHMGGGARVSGRLPLQALSLVG